MLHPPTMYAPDATHKKLEIASQVWGVAPLFAAYTPNRSFWPQGLEFRVWGSGSSPKSQIELFTARAARADRA